MKRHGRLLWFWARWRRSWPAGVVAVAVVLVTACGGPPDPPGPGEETSFDLLANVPVAAAQIELSREPGVTLVGVEALRPGVLVRAVSRGDRMFVAWVAESSTAGPQIRLNLARTVPAIDPPEVLASASFAVGDGADLGASSLRWRVADGTSAIGETVLGTFGGTPAAGALRAWFADHPLGDLGRSGGVDVQDALRLLDLLRYGGWDDFHLYHGDLDGDGMIDAADLTELLEKVVDPELPAALHVKPGELAFLQLSGAADDPGLVLIANRGRRPFADLRWTAPDGTLGLAAAGIDGHSLALEVSLPNAARLGWRPGMLEVRDGSGPAQEVLLGHLVLLVAGQSNASGRGLPVSGWPEVPSLRVRMLGNDYAWKAAVEPLDSIEGQVDAISIDDAGTGPRYEPGYSFGTRLGHLLADATGHATYLIPTAAGGTRVTLAPTNPDSWLPGAPLDRDTLFGSAVFRGRVSAGLEAGDPGIAQAFPAQGGPPTAIVWYQGESDATLAGARSEFVTGTANVVGSFRAQLSVPVVYVQLASHLNATTNVQQAWIAEQQRRMETGSGYGAPYAFADHHMVVAFDLPRWDDIHLNAYGQRLLAERLDLAIRQHVLGEEVDGTGPRLLGIEWDSARRITLRTTHTLRDGAVDPAYVTVFDGPPNGVANPWDPPAGTNTVPVTSVARDPSDPTRVRIQLATTPTSPSGPHVLYWAPAGIAGTQASAVKRDLIRAAAGIGEADLGLPLPSFGALAPF